MRDLSLGHYTVRSKSFCENETVRVSGAKRLGKGEYLRIYFRIDKF